MKKLFLLMFFVMAVSAQAQDPIWWKLLSGGMTGNAAFDSIVWIDASTDTIVLNQDSLYRHNGATVTTLWRWIKNDTLLSFGNVSTSKSPTILFNGDGLDGAVKWNVAQDRFDFSYSGSDAPLLAGNIYSNNNLYVDNNGTAGAVYFGNSASNIAWDNSDNTFDIATGGWHFDTADTIELPSGMDLVVADTVELIYSDSLDPYALHNRGATTGQVLKWNATNKRWEPAADATASGSGTMAVYEGSTPVGSGVVIERLGSGFDITVPDSVSDVTIAADLSELSAVSFPEFGAMTNTAGNLLVADGASDGFVSRAVTGDISVTAAGVVSFTADSVTAAEIGANAVGNSELQDNITITNLTVTDIDAHTLSGNLSLNGNDIVGAAGSDITLVDGSYVGLSGAGRIIIGDGTSGQDSIVVWGANVGIGDMTPTYTLDVSGTIRATSNISSDAMIQVNLDGGTAPTTAYLQFNGGTGEIIHQNTTGTDYFTVDDSTHFTGPIYAARMKTPLDTVTGNCYVGDTLTAYDCLRITGGTSKTDLYVGSMGWDTTDNYINYEALYHGSASDSQALVWNAAPSKANKWAPGTIGAAYLSAGVLLETEIDASSELAAIMDDETGSGVLVFGTSPTITTPTLTLQTGNSTTSGEMRYDATNDRLTVGDGAATDTFYSGNWSGADHTRLHNIYTAADHNGTANTLPYVNSSQAVTGLALGAAGTILTSGGPSGAPTWGTDPSTLYETITNVGKIGDDTANFKTAYGWGDADAVSTDTTGSGGTFALDDFVIREGSNITLSVVNSSPDTLIVAAPAGDSSVWGSKVSASDTSINWTLADTIIKIRAEDDTTFVTPGVNPVLVLGGVGLTEADSLNVLAKFYLEGTEVDPNGIASGQILKYNGTKFVAANDSVGAGGSGDLSPWDSTGGRFTTLVDNNDSVCIGGDTPAEKLHVVGTGLFTGNVQSYSDVYIDFDGTAPGNLYFNGTGGRISHTDAATDYFTIDDSTEFTSNIHTPAITIDNDKVTGMGTGATEGAWGNHNHSGVYEPADATLTDIADGTIAENLVNTANPWADAEVADDITCSNYQPLEATLTDIADGTIAENLVNTANPWADAEVADDITVSTINAATETAIEGAIDALGALTMSGSINMGDYDLTNVDMIDADSVVTTRLDLGTAANILSSSTDTTLMILRDATNDTTTLKTVNTSEVLRIFGGDTATAYVKISRIDVGGLYRLPVTDPGTGGGQVPVTIAGGDSTGWTSLKAQVGDMMTGAAVYDPVGESVYVNTESFILRNDTASAEGYILYNEDLSMIGDSAMGSGYMDTTAAGDTVTFRMLVEPTDSTLRIMGNLWVAQGITSNSGTIGALNGMFSAGGALPWLIHQSGDTQIVVHNSGTAYMEGQGSTYLVFDSAALAHATISTSLTIPTGTNPSVDAVGDLGDDSDDRGLSSYDTVFDAACLISRVVSKTLPFRADTTLDNDTLAFLDFDDLEYPQGFKITKLKATLKSVLVDTIIFLEWSSTSTYAVLDTLIIGSGITAEITTGFDDADIAADSRICAVFKTSPTVDGILYVGGYRKVGD